MSKDLTVNQIADALTMGATDDYLRAAAVGLLIDNESWLHRLDFRRYITLDGEGETLRGYVNWGKAIGDAEAGKIRASSSEYVILGFCASIAMGHKFSLESLTCLGYANRSFVVKALGVALDAREAKV